MLGALEQYLEGGGRMMYLGRQWRSVCGGAVSQQIDRANVLLGSPAHTLILASSENHPADFMLTREETDALYPDEQGPKLRADMTFFETPPGGAVFSATRFLDPAVFTCPPNEVPLGTSTSRG